MHEAKDVLYIHALTGLHPGSGTALGVVDLPVQRERHTQGPVIPGSSIKGVLRDACRENAKASHGGDRRNANEENVDITTVFGPARIAGEADSYAGAVAFTDARLLAFPVRSLKGVIAWVTCPAVLDRYRRDMNLAGAAMPAAWPAPAKDHAAFGTALQVDASTMVLEGFDFKHAGPNGNLTALAQHLSKSVGDAGTAARLNTHLAVLHDDDFTHFVRHATEVVARVGLDYEK